MRSTGQMAENKSIPSTGCPRPSLRAAGFQGGVGNLERPCRYRSAFSGVHRQHRYGTLARGPRRADQVESDTGLCRSQDFRRRRACGPGNCSIPDAELKRPEPDHSLIGFGARVNDRVWDFPAITYGFGERQLPPSIRRSRPLFHPPNPASQARCSRSPITVIHKCRYSLHFTKIRDS